MQEHRFVQMEQAKTKRMFEVRAKLQEMSAYRATESAMKREIKQAARERLRSKQRLLA